MRYPTRKPNALPPKTKTIQKFSNGGNVREERLDERLERLLYEYEDGPKPKHYDDPRIIDSENFKRRPVPFNNNDSSTFPSNRNQRQRMNTWELTYMTIDKEIRQGISPQDSAILKLARNQVELDELIEAREFLEALEKAREDGYKGSDKDFAKEYYRDSLNEGGSPDKTFKPSPDDLYDTFLKTMEARSKLTPEELKIIDELVDKSLNRKK